MGPIIPIRKNAASAYHEETAPQMSAELPASKRDCKEGCALRQLEWNGVGPMGNIQLSTSTGESKNFVARVASQIMIRPCGAPPIVHLNQSKPSPYEQPTEKDR